jgi:hypothetical protein
MGQVLGRATAALGLPTAVQPGQVPGSTTGEDEGASRFWSSGACPHRALDPLILAGGFYLPVLSVGPGGWKKKTKKSVETYKIYIFKVLKKGKKEGVSAGGEEWGARLTSIWSLATALASAASSKKS